MLFSLFNFQSCSNILSEIEVNLLHQYKNQQQVFKLLMEL